jgi:O-antigen ligase
MPLEKTPGTPFDEGLSRIFAFSILALVFLQPVNHVNALRLIFFYAALGIFLFRAFRQGWRSIEALRDPTVLVLLLLAGWSVVSSILGPYPGDSLDAIRKSLLIQLLLYIAVLTDFRQGDRLQLLMRVIVASFALTTLLAGAEIFMAGLARQSFSFSATHEMFVGGYASHAAFYLPFILLWLLSYSDGRWLRLAGIATLAVGVAIVFLYNSRTALVAVAAAFLLIPLLTGRTRLFLALVAAILIAGMFLIALGGAGLEKYRSLASTDTYTTNAGLSARLSVWAGAWDIVRERFMLGYGYGWKKLALVINDFAWLERWKDHQQDIIAYYAPAGQASYGKVNPHSLLLQILFETGLIGLLIYATFWITGLGSILRNFRKSSAPAGTMINGSLGIIAAFFCLNLTNGYWEGSLANMMLVFMAMIRNCLPLSTVPAPVPIQAPS